MRCGCGVWAWVWGVGVYMYECVRVRSAMVFTSYLIVKDYTIIRKKVSLNNLNNFSGKWNRV